MKRILIIAVLALFATASFAQTTQKQALKKVYDEDINDQIWDSLINYLCGDDKSKCFVD